MKKLFVVMFLISISSIRVFALENVLFILESKSDIIVKVYNNFQNLYRGNCNWVMKSELTNELLKKYNATVEMSSGNYGSITIKANSNSGSYYTSNGGASNSELTQEQCNSLLAMNYAFDLLKKFDKKYYDLLLDKLKDHFEDLFD